MTYRDQAVACPRCQLALETITQIGHKMLRCKQCLGAFVASSSLGAMYRALGVLDPIDLPTFKPAASTAGLPCPACHAVLKVVVFDGVRGPIEIDQCEAHGTWFDQGELAALLHVASAKTLRRTED